MYSTSLAFTFHCHLRAIFPTNEYPIETKNNRLCTVQYVFIGIIKTNDQMDPQNAYEMVLLMNSRDQ